MNAAFVDDIDPIESKDVVPSLENGTASDNYDHDVSINVSERQTYSSTFEYMLII